MAVRQMGPATENLFRDVHDESQPLEKALFHLLSYAHDRWHDGTHDLKLSLAMLSVEQELKRIPTETKGPTE